MTKPIKLYTLSTCSHCKAAKKFLNDCKVQYEFIDVDLLDVLEKASVIAEVRAINPQCSFPTILIGEKVIIGYRKDEIKEALGVS